MSKKDIDEMNNITKKINDAVRAKNSKIESIEAMIMTLINTLDRQNEIDDIVAWAEAIRKLEGLKLYYTQDDTTFLE